MALCPIIETGSTLARLYYTYYWYVPYIMIRLHVRLLASSLSAAVTRAAAGCEESVDTLVGYWRPANKAGAATAARQRFAPSMMVPSMMWQLMSVILVVATPQLPRCALRPVLTQLQLPSWSHANERGALAVGRIGASARITGAVYDDARQALLLTNAGRGARAGAPLLALRCRGGHSGNNGDGGSSNTGDGPSQYPAPAPVRGGRVRDCRVETIVRATADSASRRSTSSAAVRALLPRPFGLAVDVQKRNVYVTNAAPAALGAAVAAAAAAAAATARTGPHGREEAAAVVRIDQQGVASAIVPSHSKWPALRLLSPAPAPAPAANPLPLPLPCSTPALPALPWMIPKYVLGSSHLFVQRLPFHEY